MKRTYTTTYSKKIGSTVTNRVDIVVIVGQEGEVVVKLIASPERGPDQVAVVSQSILDAASRFISEVTGNGTD